MFNNFIQHIVQFSDFSTLLVLILFALNLALFVIANPYHAILSLLAIYLCTSVLLLNVHAEFFALFLILLYAVGLIIIFLFAIRILNIKYVQQVSWLASFLEWKDIKIFENVPKFFLVTFTFSILCWVVLSTDSVAHFASAVFSFFILSDIFLAPDNDLFNAVIAQYFDIGENTFVTRNPCESLLDFWRFPNHLYFWSDTFNSLPVEGTNSSLAFFKPLYDFYFVHLFYLGFILLIVTIGVLSLLSLSFQKKINLKSEKSRKALNSFIKIKKK